MVRMGSKAVLLARARPPALYCQTDAIWGRGCGGREWRERGDVPITAALGLLSVKALSPQASTLHFHSSGVKSTPCPLASRLGDVAPGWLYWPACSRKALLPLSNNFTAEAVAGGRVEGGQFSFGPAFNWTLLEYCSHLASLLICPTDKEPLAEGT